MSQKVLNSLGGSRVARRSLKDPGKYWSWQVHDVSGRIHEGLGWSRQVQEGLGGSRIQNLGESKFVRQTWNCQDQFGMVQEVPGGLGGSG